MPIPNFEIQNLPKNCNEALILASVFKEKKHGYQIALDIEEKSNSQFRFNHGTLYPILHKLEKSNLLSSNWEQEGPKRKRKYYSITPGGKEYVTAQLNEWRSFVSNFFNIVEDIDR